MIYNFSTILRESMKQHKDFNTILREMKLANNKGYKPCKLCKPHNLTIDIELANRKSIELYTKYNANTLPVPKFRILDLDQNSNSNSNEVLVERRFGKILFTFFLVCNIFSIFF